MDMVLSIQYGAHAASMYRNREFGRMVVYNNGEMSSVTIKEGTAHLKSVTENNQLYQLAK
jgi:6-phosphofructokinase 1